MDDLIIKTPQGFDDDIKVHLNVLEFVFYATKIYGFRFSHSKCEILIKSFKFLGHQFNTESESCSIPPERLKAIENFRAPRSCAESFSRLCTLAYHARYLPLYKILSLPIWEMANSGVFRWERIHQQSWAALELLCRLAFSMNSVDKNSPLFVCSDAS